MQLSFETQFTFALDNDELLKEKHWRKLAQRVTTIVQEEREVLLYLGSQSLERGTLTMGAFK